jgi:hypothetical protein
MNNWKTDNTTIPAEVKGDFYNSLVSALND